MGRKPKTSRPSFFKVLIEDYASRLRLPHVFVEKYGKFLLETAKLRTSSGKIWDVKLGEETYDDDEDEKYWCFNGGWSKFVKDLGLKLGEFIVFWFNVGESTFDVSVYGTHCCEREISGMDVDSDADEEDIKLNNVCHNVPDVSKKRLRSCINSESEGAVTARKTKSRNLGNETHHHPRFEVVLTDNQKSRWCLPKKFVEAAGLIGKRAAVLEYPPKQRHWAVILDPRPGPNSRLDMAVGWNKFRRENNLAVGKTYSFEFNPTKNVIQVKDDTGKNC